MGSRVAVVGAGHAGYAAATPGVSYKELMFEAARRAYADAGVDPRRDIDSFVCVSEDFQEGTSIFDEYVPDQLGAVRRPVQTVASDGLGGVATAVMLLRSGIATVVAVEAHSKASNVVTQGRIDQFAMDPIVVRPLDLPVEAIAGLEMHAFLDATGATERQCALVAARARSLAVANGRAAYGRETSVEEVLDSAPLAWPLRELGAAQGADGCIVLVLATDDRASELQGRPIWIDGVGWSTGSAALEDRDWGSAEETASAADAAYGRAAIDDPAREVGLAEVDDAFAYRELMHVEALRLARPGEAGTLAERGWFEPGGRLPVNPKGGSLGEGYLHEAAGLARMLSCVERLRERAGRPQAGESTSAVVHSWRGHPSASAAVAVLRGDGSVAA
jgi:acetyl-CoA C-acetyltransferase